MKYYYAVNYGKGFITHEDSERCYISGWPGDIWLTSQNEEWAQRVNATEKTKQEAQSILDTAISETIYPPEYTNSDEQVIMELPDHQSC